MRKEIELFIAFAIGFIIVLSNGVTYIQGFKSGYNRAIDDVIAGCKQELQRQGLDPQDFDAEIEKMHSNRYD
jgi:hypothetical protein